MPFVSTISGAWPVSRFGAFRVQLPVGSHLQLREARGCVGVQLQPRDSGARGVLQHRPGNAACGRVAHRQHPAEALRLVAFHHKQRVGGAVEDPGAGAAAGQGEVSEPGLGHNAQRGHLHGGPHRGQARAQHSDAVHPAIDGENRPSAGPETSSIVSRSHRVGTCM